jgi:hypothetical protein
MRSLERRMTSDALQIRRRMQSSLLRVFVGFLLSLRPWLSMPPAGLAFLGVALALYAAVIGIGFKSYFPRTLPSTDSRAILEDLDRENELLMEWTTLKLIEFRDKNREIGCSKGFWTKFTMVLLLAATLSLGLSFMAH